MIRLRTTVAAALATLVALAASPPTAAQEVAIEKRTNGQDADVPPGPALQVGAPVTWTYEVTNNTVRDLVEIVVSDDQGVAVSCPATTLGAGEAMTCTGNGTAEEGQYANVGTVDAEQLNGTPISDSDPSHYFGQDQPGVSIETSTAGQDADAPPGPSLVVGAAVAWEYLVQNLSTEPLSDVEVTDDQGVTVSCPQTTLAAGEWMTCTAGGTVAAGQYANVGSVTALLPDESQLADSDPSHHFGQTLLLDKRTNGEGADTPPGPKIEAGGTVTWTYHVTNPGPATVTGLAVTDDQGVTVSCPQTTIAADDTVVCAASDTAVAGQYANVGTATAVLPLGGVVTASDPSHYLGGLIRIEKSTNGVDADSPPGPELPVGAAVTWEYVVSNFSGETVADIDVEDDQGVAVACPQTTLDDGESMTCDAAGTAQAGQYANVGTVTATHPRGQIADTDPSHYFGRVQLLDFGDAPDPAFPTLFASNGARHLLGSGVFLGACVDAELDGQPNTTATGDDAAAGTTTFGTCAVAGDDEDGVTFTSPLVAGQTANVEVVASAPCTLSAWIDFSGDGDWNDPGEALSPGGTPLAAGANPLSFPVPAGTARGTRVSRFRCTTDGETPPDGDAADGEVEDHPVVIVSPALAATKTAIVADDEGGVGAAPGGTLLYTVVVSNDGDAAAEGVIFTDSPDPNSALVAGSVTTSAGTVVSGNTAGDTTVEVAIGSLAAGATLTIEFAAVIDAPLPPEVTEIVNQGLVTADDLADVPTDDPAPPGPDDPTAIAVGRLPVTAIPTLSTWGAAALALLLAGLAWRRLGGGD